MRPSPQEVRAWFVGAVSEEALAGHLRTLRDDPNWRVVAIPGLAVQTLTLLYWPTGERVEIVLRRDDAAWRAHS